MDSDHSKNDSSLTVTAAQAVSKIIADMNKSTSAMKASSAFVNAVNEISKTMPTLKSHTEILKVINNITINTPAITASADLLKTLNLLSNNLPWNMQNSTIKKIDEIIQSNSRADGILGQMGINLQPLWTDDFVRQMTGFRRIAEQLGQHQKDYRSYLHVINQAHLLNTATNIESATVESLINLRFLRYELINEPIAEIPSSKIILLDETARVKKAIRDIYNDNELIFKIEPRNFEEMVAELLRKKGFDVKLTKQTRDGGYDLIAVNNIAGFPYRFLVECKRYARNRKIDVNIIRSFCQVMNTNNSNGIIVTSSFFSPDAIDYQAKHAPHQLHFKDNGDIIDWVSEYIR
ncbi:restriction endonuclease [Mucilaginibacter sp. NFX135]|uniref:restriction endonuclease n=1 Tax=Mucilaginibacter sp. NFX135 TaxID=3402687 RepID=UPI003AFA7FDF